MDDLLLYVVKTIKQKYTTFNRKVWSPLALVIQATWLVLCGVPTKGNAFRWATIVVYVCGIFMVVPREREREREQGVEDFVEDKEILLYKL